MCNVMVLDVFPMTFCVKVGLACLDVVCCTLCLCKCWCERVVLMINGDGEVCGACVRVRCR